MIPSILELPSLKKYFNQHLSHLPEQNVLHLRQQNKRGPPSQHSRGNHQVAAEVLCTQITTEQTQTKNLLHQIFFENPSDFTTIFFLCLFQVLIHCQKYLATDILSSHTFLIRLSSQLSVSLEQKILRHKNQENLTARSEPEYQLVQSLLGLNKVYLSREVLSVPVEFPQFQS